MVLGHLAEFAEKWTGQESKSYGHDADFDYQYSSKHNFLPFVQAFFEKVLQPSFPDADIKASYVRNHLTEAKAGMAAIRELRRRLDTGLTDTP